MENEAYGGVIGNSNAPYQNSLAAQCGLATNFHNESHGSLNNYIAATDGQNILGTDFVSDCLPDAQAGLCVSGNTNIFSQVQAAGMSWKNYAENMPSNCYRTNSGDYLTTHVPAVYYTNLSSCDEFAVPMGSVSTGTGQFYTDVSNGTLPNFSFISPNAVDDAHDTGTAAGDSWLSKIIPRITSGSNYQSGNTVVFITNDEGTGSDYTNNEDCSSQGLDAGQPSCHIPTIVVAPFVHAGLEDGSFYTHYSMLRTTEELLGLPLLGLASGANSMAANLNLGPVSDTFAPPSAPSSLTATTSSSSQVDLRWSSSAAGDTPVTGYQITRNGVAIATTNGAGTSYADVSAIAGTSYTYTVEGLDGVGNVSSASNSATAATPSTSNLLSDPNFTSWSSKGPAGWSAYGSHTTVTKSGAGEDDDPAAVIATTASSASSAGISDGSPPTINGTTVGGTTDTASCWLKASKVVDVAVQLRETGQPAVTTALALPTFGAWYQVQVSDTAVESGDSMPMTVYSPDMVSGITLSVSNCSLAADTTPTDSSSPPSQPQNVTAVARSPSQVDLSWSASTGSNGISHYVILRDGKEVGTATSTSYSDNTVSAGTTYSYQVEAVDSAGSVSTPSSVVDVTTPAATNLLSNPDFSDWTNGQPVGWYTYGPLTRLTQSTDAYGGNTYSVKVATTSTSYAASGMNAGSSSSSPIIMSTRAGVTYSGSCWVKASELIAIDVQLHEFTSTGNSANTAAVTSFKVPSTSSWYNVGVSYTTIGTGNRLWFSIYSTNTVAGGATFEVGSCSLTSGQSEQLASIDPFEGSRPAADSRVPVGAADGSSGLVPGEGLASDRAGSVALARRSKNPRPIRSGSGIAKWHMRAEASLSNSRQQLNEDLVVVEPSLT